MRKVELFEVGDTVVFDNPNYNYVIEEISETHTGRICHSFNNGTATSCYDKGEILYASK